RSGAGAPAGRARRRDRIAPRRRPPPPAPEAARGRAAVTASRSRLLELRRALQRADLDEHRLRLCDTLRVDPVEIRGRLEQRLLDRVLERHRRGGTAVARPGEAQAGDTVLDAEQLDVAAVGTEVRPHLVERLPHARLEVDRM